MKSQPLALLPVAIALVFGAAACESDEPQTPSTELACSDTLDNDQDGQIDCLDPDCAQDPGCLCGDGVCDAALGEESSCPLDCPNPCGDGVCDDAAGETSSTCPADCPERCGNAICEDVFGEDEMSCPADCDTTCDPAGGQALDQGADAACETCSVTTCACDLEACEATGDNEQCSTWDGCIVSDCPECFYQICDAAVPDGTPEGIPFGFLFQSDCADCLGTHCCTEYSVCTQDATCIDCVFGANPTACDQTTLDDDMLSCQAASCSTDCAP